VTQDPRPSWAQARHLAFAHGAPLGIRTVPFDEACGRRLARDVIALSDLPHYASSAMDGWAVAGAAPWTLVDEAPLREGHAVAIVTGAPVPEGASAILRSEHGIVSGEGPLRRVSTSPNARPDEPRVGEHIRVAATEALAGETLIEAGRVLNPAHIAVAAAAGHDELAVSVIPRVALVLTGDEVVQRGVPGIGQVRDSFGPVLPPLLAALGVEPVSTTHLRDSLAELVDSLLADPEASDLVVTTGGTGNSDADHLRSALLELGAEIVVDGIRMRPGGPSLLARLPDGRMLIGLPGNPLAALIGLFTLGEPLFAALTGGPEPETRSVVAGTELAGRAQTSILIPYRMQDAVAVPANWRGSAMMRGIAESDGVMICPPEGVLAGQVVNAFRLPWAT
jgi:molybdopterin molybdotransferase